MGCGVAVEGYAIGACGDDLAVFYYHSAEGTSAIFYAFRGETYGLTHEYLVLFCYHFI